MSKYQVTTKDCIMIQEESSIPIIRDSLLTNQKLGKEELKIQEKRKEKESFLNKSQIKLEELLKAKSRDYLEYFEVGLFEGFSDSIYKLDNKLNSETQRVENELGLNHKKDRSYIVRASVIKSIAINGAAMKKEEGIDDIVDLMLLKSLININSVYLYRVLGVKAKTAERIIKSEIDHYIMNI